MTFVLSCLTEHTVLQVSDRRLVRLDGARSPTVIDDERNKAVFAEARVAFSYTGLAEINGEKTDDWLARIVSEVKVNDFAAVTKTIQDSATAAFATLRYSAAVRRHAFQAVGWFRFPGHRELRPAVLTITNAAASDGSWLPEAQDRFRSSVASPPLKQGIFLASAGFRPDASQRRSIHHFVRRPIRRGASIAACLQCMIIAVRWLSERHPTIGPGLMALSVPRIGVEHYERTGNFAFLTGGPLTHEPTFLYLSADGSRATVYGPHVVIQGNRMLNFTVTTVK